jgi:hypothetical protein
MSNQFEQLYGRKEITLRLMRVHIEQDFQIKRRVCHFRALTDYTTHILFVSLFFVDAVSRSGRTASDYD